MLQKLCKIGKSCLFVAIASVLVYGITMITLPKIPDFYEEEDWDVVFFGTSQAYMSFWPAIFDEYGLKTYNRGRPEQTLNLTYYYIKDALEVSDIDVVVLEVFAAHYGENDHRFKSKDIWESSLGDFRYSAIKAEAIRECLPKEAQFKYLFPLDKYHSNWEEWKFTSVEDFLDSVTNPYYEEENDRGYFYTDISQYCDYPMPEVIFAGNREVVYEENMRYLEKIYELCLDNDAELILVKAPFPCYEVIIGEVNTVFDWAEEKGIPYLNLMQFTNEIGINYYSDTCDGIAHMNYLGATKVSRYLAEYILQHYY